MGGTRLPGPRSEDWRGGTFRRHPAQSSRRPRLRATLACTHHTVFCALLLPRSGLRSTCNLAPGTCNLQPAICNLQPATCNLQPRTTCTGAGSPSSGFATTSWQECLLFFCPLLLYGVLGGG